MNERSIDAGLTVAAVFLGVSLLAAAGMRVFAPVSSIVVAAPASKALAIVPTARELPHRRLPPHARIRVALERLRTRPLRAAQPRSVSRVAPTRMSRLHEPTPVVTMHAPKHLRASTVSQHLATRLRSAKAAPITRHYGRKHGIKAFTALPDPPIGYDPQPMIAGPEAEAPAMPELTETFPTVNRQGRRRR